MIELPPWLANKPDGPNKNASINRFYLRVAALYASEEGTLEKLAFLIGINFPTLKSQAQSICPASRITKEGIRRILGNHFVPPNLLTFRSQRRNGDL